MARFYYYLSCSNTNALLILNSHLSKREYNSARKNQEGVNFPRNHTAPVMIHSANLTIQLRIYR